MSFHSRSVKETKSPKKEEDEESITNFCCLPQDIVKDIISRLPIKSVIQSCRLVCQSWLLLSKDPRLFHLHLSRNPGFKFLFFHSCDNHGTPNKLHFIELSDHENGTLTKIRTPFTCFTPGFKVLASCNGLLCLEGGSANHSMCVYNLFTRECKVVSPRLDWKHLHQYFWGFGYNPISKEYKLVRIGYSFKNDRAESEVYSLSRNEWRSIGELPYKLDPLSWEGVLFNRRLHWISERRTGQSKYSSPEILSFDLIDDSFREVPTPTDTIFKTSRSPHLAVLGGCLSVAVSKIGPAGLVHIWVMKEYAVKESWMKQCCLGPAFCVFVLEWRVNLDGRVRILCLLNNGEILIDYNGEALLSYNCDTKVCKNVTFGGTMPMSRFMTTLS